MRIVDRVLEKNFTLSDIAASHPCTDTYSVTQE